MISKKDKKDIRRRAKSILHAYMNDGHYENKVDPMTFYFKAVRSIMKSNSKEFYCL